MAHWYVKSGDKTYGPFDAAKLKSLASLKKISPKSLVRRGTESEWVAAGRVKGLFGESDLSSGAAPKSPPKGNPRAATSQPSTAPEGPRVEAHTPPKLISHPAIWEPALSECADLPRRSDISVKLSTSFTTGLQGVGGLLLGVFLLWLGAADIRDPNVHIPYGGLMVLGGTALIAICPLILVGVVVSLFVPVGVRRIRMYALVDGLYHRGLTLPDLTSSDYQLAVTGFVLPRQQNSVPEFFMRLKNYLDQAKSRNFGETEVKDVSIIPVERGNGRVLVCRLTLATVRRFADDKKPKETWPLAIVSFLFVKSNAKNWWLVLPPPDEPMVWVEYS